MKFLYFFKFLYVIYALLDPDPDPATQINADPCGSGPGFGSGTSTPEGSGGTMNRVFRFQVRVLRSKKRIGLTRARLMGVEAATAPVLTFLGKISSQDLYFSMHR